MKNILSVFIAILIAGYPLCLSASWQSDGSLKIAVMDIVSRVGSEHIDSATISDMLQARLVEKKAFKIVERSMLNKILEEKKLHMMGLTDADASSVGAMAGADKIITGSIARMADSYVILVKGIDTRTGVVELTDQEASPDIRSLPNAIQIIADRFMRKARGELFATTTSPVLTEKVVFKERFQNNQNGWPIGDWDSAEASLAEGQYVIRMKAHAPIFYSKIDVVVDQATDFSVEATVAKLKGADENLSYYGIIFGLDFKNMYEFLVHPNGKCMIRLLQNGETIFIQPSATSAHVQRGNAANTLRIRKVGEYLKFYVNGQYINQDRPKTPIPNSFLIGYEVWRTEGEMLVIAGKSITISQNIPFSINIPPIDGAYTPWMPGDDFGKQMDKYWKDGYYPANVEGRNHDGTSEFRASLKPFPKRTWWFYWWYGQPLSSYEDHKKRLTSEGFEEIHLQDFTDRDGIKRYQTCWIKFGS